MITQAKVYRLAGLLIIHQLRYQLSIQNSTGQAYANEIIDSLFTYVLSRPKDFGIIPMLFPLFLAMLEVEGPGERILEFASTFSVQELHVSKMREFVAFVKRQRKNGFRGLWFSLAEDYSACFSI